MSAIQFLGEWALRSSILIFGGALLIWIVRIKDPALRLAAWIALLLGSLLIPAISMMLPVLPLRILRSPVPSPTQVLAAPAGFTTSAPAALRPAALVPEQFNWYRAGLMLYAIVTAAMLLRLCVGLVLSWRILRRGRRTDRDFIASPDIPSPATIGILRPIVVLPEDWRDWDRDKLESVLAHERSHVERGDPAVQFVSAIHRALLWFSPAAWFLHSKIVRAGEELSDDAAVGVTADRAVYAGVLLDFMKRRALPRHYLGVPMSRYGSTDRRIQRILESSVLSRGMSWIGLAAMLAITAPLAWFIAAASPAIAAAPAPELTAPVKAAAAPPAVHHGPGRNGGLHPAPVDGAFLGLGSVQAGVVVIHASVAGSLKSIDFQEGEPVHAGDVVAVIGRKGPADALASDERQVDIVRQRLDKITGATQAERDLAQQQIQALQEQIEDLRAEAADVQIKAPVSGIAGLRLIEPGNMVQPSDPIVTIAEVEPISVLFTLPESTVPKIRELFDSGKRPTAEAWNNNSSVLLATGVLSGMDNQIDEKTGTIKLKATFENKDRKLYPNQFVNVKLLTK
ncbi:MAG TPA: M56 family metallopeptidase [Bryobacteraceae bacterium]|nr:M56 family metallopeptidase [Bryobacteraceae bacterium]